MIFIDRLVFKISDFQFVEKYAWIESGISYHLGIDGVSILFVILTTMLVPICILASYESIKFSVKEYLISFLALETFMIDMDFFEVPKELVACEPVREFNMPENIPAGF